MNNRTTSTTTNIEEKNNITNNIEDKNNININKNNDYDQEVDDDYYYITATTISRSIPTTTATTTMIIVIITAIRMLATTIIEPSSSFGAFHITTTKGRTQTKRLRERLGFCFFCKVQFASLKYPYPRLASKPGTFSRLASSLEYTPGIFSRLASSLESLDQAGLPSDPSLGLNRT